MPSATPSVRDDHATNRVSHMWPNPLPLLPTHPTFFRRRYHRPARRSIVVHIDLSCFCRPAVKWGSLMCLVVAILYFLVWMFFLPTSPKLHVGSASMSALKTSNTTASAGVNLTIIFTNPNRYFTAMYVGMRISLHYPSRQVQLSQENQPSFDQMGKSWGIMELSFSFTDVDFGTDTIQNMRQDLDHGILHLGVEVHALVMFMSGKWKSRFHIMRAYCGAVNFGFNSSYQAGIFLNPFQKFDVYLSK